MESEWCNRGGEPLFRMATVTDRQQFGLAALDRHLGGGLVPGTLTVIAGATGSGKTHLGLHFANHGLAQEGCRGVIFDMTARGDSQNHADYARRLAGWDLRAHDGSQTVVPPAIWDPERRLGDYLHIFTHGGRRVTRQDLTEEEWRLWKAELVQQLRQCIFFLYGHFIRGVRRVVIDGVEPAARFSDSIQFQLFEYIYHQILRKDPAWVARDLFRELFHANQPQVEAHPYDPSRIGCLYLYTTPEVMLDDLIVKPIGEGDIFANASTVILLGRRMIGTRVSRALYVAKQRGSACSDEILPLDITSRGVEVG